jgi:hypothetical protein
VRTAGRFSLTSHCSRCDLNGQTLNDEMPAVRDAASHYSGFLFRSTFKDSTDRSLTVNYSSLEQRKPKAASRPQAALPNRQHAASQPRPSVPFHPLGSRVW